MNIAMEGLQMIYRKVVMFHSYGNISQVTRQKRVGHLWAKPGKAQALAKCTQQLAETWRYFGRNGHFTWFKQENQTTKDCLLKYLAKWSPDISTPEHGCLDWTLLLRRWRFVALDGYSGYRFHRCFLQEIAWFWRNIRVRFFYAWSSHFEAYYENLWNLFVKIVWKPSFGFLPVGFPLWICQVPSSFIAKILHVRPEIPQSSTHICSFTKLQRVFVAWNHIYVA